MKSIDTTSVLSPPPDQPPRMTVNVAGVAELYAAASALEPTDQGIAKMGDATRVSLITTAGTLKQLMAALAIVRGQS